MSDIHDAYFTACSQLASRYGEATGGSAQATLSPCEEGGVVLTYLEQILPSTGPEPRFAVVSEEPVSLMRALDSLALSLADVLEANCRNLAVAAMRIGEPRALQGVVALDMYCPAWGGSTALYCRYKANVALDQMSVTLYPMRRCELSDDQGAGWDYMYSAGVVGELPRVLPWIAQGVAQLLFLNRATELDVRTVLLPGAHRQQSAFPSDSLVLANFPSGGPAWQLSTRGSRLQVDSEPGAVELTGMQRMELTLAMARWQTMCEALAEQRAMHQQTETTTTRE
jgi:hypothetical protein